MGRHTPGRWFVSHEEPYEMTLETADGQRVPGITLWLDDCCFDTNDERLANAHLAASAPDMLHELKTIASYLRDSGAGDAKNRGEPEFEILQSITKLVAQVERK